MDFLNKNFFRRAMDRFSGQWIKLIRHVSSMKREISGKPREIAWPRESSLAELRRNCIFIQDYGYWFFQNNFCNNIGKNQMKLCANVLQSSFSKLSVTSLTSQLILQLFRRFTYITAHSPTLPLLHLRHSSSPTLLLLLCHRLFTYITWRSAHAMWWLGYFCACICY